LFDSTRVKYSRFSFTAKSTDAWNAPEMVSKRLNPKTAAHTMLSQSKSVKAQKNRLVEQIIADKMVDKEF